MTESPLLTAQCIVDSTDDDWEMSERLGSPSFTTSESDSECEKTVVPMRFEQLTRESDVKLFTGLPSTKAFRCIFNYPLPKAKTMQYWRGAKQTQKEQLHKQTAFKQFAGRSDV